MTQIDLGLDLSTKRTRKREFLEEMRRVVPWSKLIALIEPHDPKGKTGRSPFPVATMLHIHVMQQWFGLSDPAMEETLCDVPLYRDFAGLDGGMTRLPDESTIVRFRHLLEAHGLAGKCSHWPMMRSRCQHVSSADRKPSPRRSRLCRPSIGRA
jgi:transposase, IS5 family